MLKYANWSIALVRRILEKLILHDYFKKKKRERERIIKAYIFKVLRNISFPHPNFFNNQPTVSNAGS